MRKFIRESLPVRSKQKRNSRIQDEVGVHDVPSRSEVMAPSIIHEKPLLPPNETPMLPVKGSPDYKDLEIDVSFRQTRSAPLQPTAIEKQPLRRHKSVPNLQSYHYEGLPHSTSLRLLELLPGAVDDHIRCKLHVSDWVDPLPFEAISYAWGNTHVKVSIVCDGRKLSVTPNLADCLRQLRRLNESRFLWADAICINQTDLEERGHQVDNMRLIYQCATSLIVWLGRDDDQIAKRVKRAMYDLARKCCDAKGTTIDDLADFDTLWEIVACPPYRVAMRMEDWQDMEQLYLSAWFSRLWVVQEIVTSKKARLHRGEISFNWDVVGLVAAYIQSWSHVLDWKFLNTGVYNCYIMRNRANHSNAVPSLLEWSRTFRCRDPLDRVYAMLGFPAFRQKGFSVQANYKRAPAQLFILIAHLCIQADSSLEILCYNDHTQNSHLRKPSWVPQWDPGTPGWTIGYRRTSWRWSASKGKSLQAHIDFDTSILHATGILLDVVTEYQEINNTQWFPHNPTRDHPLLQMWKQTYPHDGWTHPSGHRAIDVFGGIFVAGIPSNECSCCTREEIVRRDYGAYLIRCAEEAGEDTNAEMFKELYHKGARGDWKGYEQNGMNFCHGRAFFKTETGWMGLGPNTVQAGDRIVLLYGGDVPFVIRPRDHGNGYVLIGEAYVHAIMEGELFAENRAGDFEERIWEIS